MLEQVSNKLSKEHATTILKTIEYYQRELKTSDLKRQLAEFKTSRQPTSTFLRLESRFNEIERGFYHLYPNKEFETTLYNKMREIESLTPILEEHLKRL